MEIVSNCVEKNHFFIPPELCNIQESLSLGGVTQAVNQLKERLGISEPIDVNECKDPNDLCSSSSGRFHWAKERSYIRVNLAFLSSATPGEREFILLHELQHIKNRDSRTDFYVDVSMLPLLLAGVVLVARVVSISSPFIQVVSVGLVWLITRVARSIPRQLQEIRADKEAFKVCSNEGKQGAITFYERAVKEDGEWSLPFRVLAYSLLFFCSGLEHPFHSIRLRYIQALAQKTSLSRTKDIQCST